VVQAFNQERQHPITIWVGDISMSGLGFVSSQKMEPGTELICRFTRDKAAPLQVGMVIRHCHELSHGLYAAGGRFVKVARRAGRHPSATAHLN